ncbi:hypothetical protein DRF75_02210 [Ehrlichia minasensis]|uniref:Uncharacterized protein n=1 Tax=Ehrlichia minasensis TaxID=1242993 RepID=A0A4V2BQQ6_9RICK|nr:hypothetical protein [Ehrlichia minasensis]RZB12814.1 hypothetical protein DRF75_02210 [Ehrlichia minasensis]CEI84963.1 Uncharacterized protein ehr_00340 [Ehrlichia minasensis]
MFSDLKSSTFNVVNSSDDFGLNFFDQLFNDTDVNRTGLMDSSVNSNGRTQDDIIAIAVIIAGILIAVAIGICMFWLNLNETVLRERYMRCSRSPNALKMDQSAEPSTSGTAACNTVTDEIELQQIDDVELREKRIEEVHFPKTLISSPSNNRECVVYSANDLN